MKSFNTVYKNKKNEAINEHRANVDKGRARLLAAIKREYGIHDFSSLSESERATYKRVINEMWDRENGLNKKGIAFVNESAKPLTEASDDVTVDNYILRSLKPNAEKILQCAVEGNDHCGILTEIKSGVEKDTKRKIAKKRFVELVAKTVFPLLSKRINSFKL